MNFFFLHSTVKNLKDQSDNTLVHNEPPHNTNEGSEFLDDAIRIEDLPLTYAEEIPGAINIGF